jgi:hypothetical protein
MIKKKNSQLRNLDGFDNEEEIEKEINCTNLVNKTGEVKGGGKVESLQCTYNNSEIVDDISDILSLEIESDEISGITEYNSNPIETDQNEGVLEVNPGNISLLDNTYLKDDKNCEESGIFDINGTLNKEVEGKDDTKIEFSNPAETGGLCKYNKTDAGKDINVECQSQDEIEEDYIIIERQYIGNNLLVNSSKTKNSVSCSIGSLSDKTDSAEAGPLGDNSTSTGTGTNRFYTTEKSSGGLSGGTITAIVLVSVFVLVAVGYEYISSEKTTDIAVSVRVVFCNRSYVHISGLLWYAE